MEFENRGAARIVATNPRRPGAGVLVALALTFASSWPALAAPVRGTVTLVGALKTGRRLQGYWRLENGIVPVAPAPNRGETVVVLEGPKGPPPAPKTTAVEISGLQASPGAVVVAEGSVVELKNLDRMAHELSTPEQTSVMAIERLAPGATRKQKFQVAGGYVVRSSQYPHLTVSVIVVDSPFFAVVDEKGGFKIPDAPDGKATLKVWSQGRWVHEQEIEVGGKSPELQIKCGGKTEDTKSDKDSNE